MSGKIKVQCLLSVEYAPFYSTIINLLINFSIIKFF
jgi:hypothetical protein